MSDSKAHILFGKQRSQTSAGTQPAITNPAQVSKLRSGGKNQAKYMSIHVLPQRGVITILSTKTGRYVKCGTGLVVFSRQTLVGIAVGAPKDFLLRRPKRAALFARTVVSSSVQCRLMYIATQSLYCLNAVRSRESTGWTD